MTALNRWPLRSDDVVSLEGDSLSDTSNDIREFISRDYGKVVAAVGTATGDHDTAQDGVQSALLKILRDGHRPDRFAAWVTVVAINEVRQTHRRRNTEKRVTKQPIDAVHPMEGVAAATDLRTAVSALPDRQRDIVLMFYYLDTAVDDIAAAMEISPGTVKTQLHRARGRLAATLHIEDRGVS